MKTRFVERGLNRGHVLIKRAAIFEKKIGPKSPKMNLEEIVEEEFVRDLVKTKLSYKAMSERLQALYPGWFGLFSWRFNGGLLSSLFTSLNINM